MSDEKDHSQVPELSRLAAISLTEEFLGMGEDKEVETRNSPMQLTYRGQGYTPSSAFTSHSIEGRYRGVHYRYDSEPATSLLRGLIYRGVSEISSFVPATAVA